ncbi:OmpA family protein [Phenylobacterium sp. LH3H17]|uniref:OmpA family protein n=1 Tax=Phenylobacterium sp. LH3H17 TaxID=2903901 RepID=UPI0020C9BB76|nr:OmpA family protein [Phenylobacterium sp. LH3H17]UTP40022.1 OmpA family protein [Phenylobacterium sp. LH3H17]
MKAQAILTITLVAGLATAGCATRAGRDRIVTATSRCEDVTVQVYFEPDSAQITSEGRAVLAQASTQAKTCRVDRVTVLGLADAAGAPAANLELSKRRAASVSEALAATGLPTAEVDLTAAGQSGATTRTGDLQPLRRRADVTVELSRPR